MLFLFNFFHLRTNSCVSKTLPLYLRGTLIFLICTRTTKDGPQYPLRSVVSLRWSASVALSFQVRNVSRAQPGPRLPPALRRTEEDLVLTKRAFSLPWPHNVVSGVGAGILETRSSGPQDPPGSPFSFLGSFFLPFARTVTQYTRSSTLLFSLGNMF